MKSIKWQNTNPTNTCEFGESQGGEEESGLGGLWEEIFIQTNQKGHLKINFDSEPGEKLEM